MYERDCECEYTKNVQGEGCTGTERRGMKSGEEDRVRAASGLFQSKGRQAPRSNHALRGHTHDYIARKAVEVARAMRSGTEYGGGNTVLQLYYDSFTAMLKCYLDILYRFRHIILCTHILFVCTLQPPGLADGALVRCHEIPSGDY